MVARRRKRNGIAISVSLFCAVQVAAFSSSQHPTRALNRRPNLLRLHADHADHDRLADDINEQHTSPGIRLNKVFKATHSRRQADELISSGRVTVNGQVVSAGQRVFPFQDVVHLDGKLIQGWEVLNALATPGDNDMFRLSTFEYTKYWKPTGVICTTDRRIRDNIIDALMDDGYSPDHRIYPVGRLDKDTSGLILLTSDGRLPNAVLRGEHKQPKTYHVTVDQPISDNDLERLRNGVVITTVAQRDGNRAPPLTAKTRPCQVERLGRKSFFMTITEGRNRQIRKMLDAVGYTVMRLERIAFAGLQLDPLQKPGDWSRLDDAEIGQIRSMIANADATAV